MIVLIYARSLSRFPFNIISLYTYEGSAEGEIISERPKEKLCNFGFLPLNFLLGLIYEERREITTNLNNPAVNSPQKKRRTAKYEQPKDRLISNFFGSTVIR